MKLFRLVFLSLFILGSFYSQAQTVDEIVDLHLKAMGGQDKWKNVQSIKMKGSLDIGPQMKAPFTMYFKDRKKMRFELEFQGMTMIQAFDGDSGWSVVPFSGKTDPERMSEEEVKGVKDQSDFTPDLYDYKVKGSVVEFLGKEDMEGTETIKLKITQKDGDLKYVYLDAQSYYPLKETSKMKFEDKEVEAVNMLSDFRQIEGLTIPFVMEGRGDEESSMGQSMVMEEVIINPTIEDSLFAMPSSNK